MNHADRQIFEGFSGQTAGDFTDSCLDKLQHDGTWRYHHDFALGQWIMYEYNIYNIHDHWFTANLLQTSFSSLVGSHALASGEVWSGFYKVDKEEMREDMEILDFSHSCEPKSDTCVRCCVFIYIFARTDLNITYSYFVVGPDLKMPVWFYLKYQVWNTLSMCVGAGRLVGWNVLRTSLS